MNTFKLHRGFIYFRAKITPTHDIRFFHESCRTWALYFGLDGQYNFISCSSFSSSLWLPFSGWCMTGSEVNVPDFRGNYILNIIRALGLLITFITSGSGLWNSVLVVYYEVLPSILFQKNCLHQIQSEVRHCAFTQHAQIISKYRQLQVLNTMFDNIYSRNFFQICMACLLVVLVSFGYFVLKVHAASSIVLVALAYVTIVAYTVLTTMLSMAGKVWFQLTKFRWCCKRNDQLAKKRMCRKYEKSLKELKVKIGSINFV
jgi:hypothetical protein